MTKTKKNIIFWTLFIAIFSILLVIATLFDKQISDLLAKPFLNDGNYYSSNEFARIFEVIGEMPLYFFVVFAGSVIIVKVKSITNKKLKIFLIALFGIVNIGVGFYGWNHFCEYLYKLNPTTLSFLDKNYFLIVLVVLAVLGSLLGYFLVNNFLLNYIDELFYVAIVILIAAAISNGITQGIKPFIGRERYRSTYYFTYRNVDCIGFTPWYIINGKTSELAARYDETLNVSKSFYTSFPSGHTTGAGIVYTMMFIPCFVKSLNTKKYKIIFISSSIIYTGIVAFARILMGAHYMSDVLFGGTIVFLSAVIGYYVANKIYLKKNHN